MKRTALILVPVMFLAASAWGQGPVYHIGVDGLACPFCAYGVEKQLQKLEGVSQIEANVAESLVIVTMEDEESLEKSQAKQAIEKAGFSLRSFETAKDNEEAKP